MDNIEEFQDENGEWRFRIKGDNGEIVAVSEGYTTEASARRGSEDLKAILGAGTPLEATEESIAPPTDHIDTEAEEDARFEEVIDAAWCYLSAARDGNGFDYRMYPMVWPWSRDLWRPGTKEVNLQKASDLVNMALEMYTERMGNTQENTNE